MWFAKAIKDLKWWDISLIKLSVFFFSFFVATYVSSEALLGGRWIWLVLGIVFALKPMGITLRRM